MEPTIIVDGYNVVNAWPELIKLKDNNLEHARDRLVDKLAGYGSYKGYRVIVVFDAHSISGAQQREEERGGVEIVYTAEGETADSYIEKLAYNLVRKGEQVFVVTSDWAEQMVILGAGAFRIPARQLERDILAAEKKMTNAFTENTLTYRRHELGSRIDGDVARRLDEMRRRR